ncbi:hypothetical protein [Secundilactobacillus collinoides]|nr:hypothetical protein [Secundilactobacillus collinoides]
MVKRHKGGFLYGIFGGHPKAINKKYVYILAKVTYLEPATSSLND